LLQLLTAALILKANGIDAFHQPAKVKAQFAACDRTEEANTVYLCQRSPQGLFLLQHGTNCLKLFELARLFTSVSANLNNDRQNFFTHGLGWKVKANFFFVLPMSL